MHAVGVRHRNRVVAALMEQAPGAARPTRAEVDDALEVKGEGVGTREAGHVACVEAPLPAAVASILHTHTPGAPPQQRALCSRAPGLIRRAPAPSPSQHSRTRPRPRPSGQPRRRRIRPAVSMVRVWEQGGSEGGRVLSCIARLGQQGGMCVRSRSAPSQGGLCRGAGQHRWPAFRTHTLTPGGPQSPTEGAML